MDDQPKRRFVWGWGRLPAYCKLHPGAPLLKPKLIEALESTSLNQVLVANGIVALTHSGDMFAWGAPENIPPTISHTPCHLCPGERAPFAIPSFSQVVGVDTDEKIVCGAYTPDQLLVTTQKGQVYNWNLGAAEDRSVGGELQPDPPFTPHSPSQHLISPSSGLTPHFPSSPIPMSSGLSTVPSTPLPPVSPPSVVISRDASDTPSLSVDARCLEVIHRLKSRSSSSSVTSSTPTSSVLSALPPIHSVACTASEVMFISKNGEIYCSCRGRAAIPLYMPPSHQQKIKAISCGFSHSLALTTIGTVLSWGCGKSGRLGLGDELNRSTPTALSRLDQIDSPVVELGCGYHHSVARTANGRVYVWGGNEFGQLGCGDKTDRSVPCKLPALATEGGASDVVAGIGIGAFHTAFLTGLGVVLTCGWGEYGQLGLGDASSRVTPYPVGALAGMNAKMVVCGGRFTLCITDYFIKFNANYFSDCPEVRFEAPPFIQEPAVPLPRTYSQSLSSNVYETSRSMSLNPSSQLSSSSTPCSCASHSLPTPCSSSVCPTPLSSSSSSSSSFSSSSSSFSSSSPSSSASSASSSSSSSTALSIHVAKDDNALLSRLQNALAPIVPPVLEIPLPAPNDDENIAHIPPSVLLSPDTSSSLSRLNLGPVFDFAPKTPQETSQFTYEAQKMNLRYSKKLEAREQQKIVRIHRDTEFKLAARGYEDREMRRQESLKKAQEENTKTWIKVVIPEWDKKKTRRKAEELGLKWGVPPSVRVKIWPLLIGNGLLVTEELHAHFGASAKSARIRWEQIKQQRTEERPALGKENSFIDIDVDLTRTFPQLAFFKPEGAHHESLRELLDTYCFYRPDVGYVQGMSYLAGIFLLYMPPYQAFVSFANFLHKPFAHAFLRLNHAKMGARYSIHEALLKEYHADLAAWFDSQSIRPEMYLMDWYIALYCKRLPIELVGRVWDCYLLFGEEFLYRTSVGICAVLKHKLIGQPLDICMKVLKTETQNISEEALFEAIASLRLPNTLVKALVDLDRYC